MLRPRTLLTAACIGLAQLALPATARPGGDAQVLLHEDFESGLSDRWIERGFPSIERKNRFSIELEDDGNHYLHVASDRSTSGRGVRLEFDPNRCPTVSWRWKVTSVIASADLRHKEGDDAAAKVYVIFDGPSRWNPLDQRLLIYVWDNQLPAGTTLPNAWQPKKAHMLVLESGADKVGQWVPERVDLADDYRRAFPGERAASVKAIAFMADTDNTSTRVSAGLDDLEIRCVSATDKVRFE
jgi:hypothetical protein